ncbi:MAG: PD40 domain-containing protein [Cyclobacteriaceae bacterium]|nr:PD40 domain-containing protein [Cyclobacteriaceae bacterium]
MRIVAITLFTALSFAVLGQPATEVFLLDLDISKDKLTVSNPVNISNHVGYDNQPSFHRAQPLVYYSSFNEDGRSDIKVYNYDTGKTESLTNTSEREYSPTLTPDGKFISCIIQRDNDAQDLGKYPVEGGEPVVLINNLIVGYHAWVDDSNLILFVLGEPQTFQWYNLKTNTNTILESNIGRSLHKIPGENAMSFVHKVSDNGWLIKRLDAKSRSITPIGNTMPGREDMAWTPDGRIVMSDGEALFFYHKKSAEWRPFEMNLSDVKFSGITRIAISSNGKKLALVAGE